METIDTSNPVTSSATTTYYNYGETEEKEQSVVCTLCGEIKRIRWVEQKQPFVYSGDIREAINTYVEELNKAGFMYLVGDKTYYFHQFCFEKIIKQKGD